MALQIKDLTKSFAGHLILNRLSFELYDGGRYGLIGENGAGKTTLLRIISGELDSDSGEIIKHKGMRIGVLKQDAGLDLTGTIGEEMARAYAPFEDIMTRMQYLSKQLEILAPNRIEYEEISSEYSRIQNFYEINDAYHFDVKIAKVLGGMGFADKPLETQIATLSGGEKTRLGLAKLLLESPDLLILDEPTNHLDFQTLAWLEEYLLGYSGIILLVSHDRYFLDKIVTDILEINHHKIHAFKGNYSKYIVLREEYYTRAWKTYEAQQEEIAKLEDYVRRNIARASTAASARGRRKTLEHMERLEKPDDFSRKVYFHFPYAGDPYKDLLTIKNLSIGYKTPSGPHILSSGIEFSVERGEKIGIIGKNGIGKSTLLKTILENEPPISGKILWGENTKIGYYEQETLDLDTSKQAIHEIWDRFRHLSELEIRKALAAVGIVGENVFKLVASMSGGEKAKLKFAIQTLSPTNVLLLDEPTNHLDLNAKEKLEKALVSYEGSMLFVSHDRYFLQKIPNRIIEMTESGVRIYDGNYDDYLKVLETESTTSSEKSIQKQNSKQLQKGSYRSKEDRRSENEKKSRIKTLEKEIDMLEQQIKLLTDEMSSPSVASDYALLTEKSDELESSNLLLEEKLLAWEQEII